ncbi:MAG: helix-turn-helix transcriptional regulator [Pelotomaculum sp.]|nr:helix-turn-helix transcriptional regulator [Pelotomaculum sp.]
MDTANRIKQLREQFGINRAELARKSGVSLSYLNEIERGIKSPTEITLRKICSALGITLSEFFSDQPPELPPEVRRLVDLANRLTPKQREILLAAAEEWAGLNQKEKGE